MVLPVIYISVSDDRRHLTIDGHLTLLERFLQAIWIGQGQDLRKPLPDIVEKSEQHTQEVQHD